MSKDMVEESILVWLVLKHSCCGKGKSWRKKSKWWRWFDPLLTYQSQVKKRKKRIWTMWTSHKSQLWGRGWKRNRMKPEKQDSTTRQMRSCNWQKVDFETKWVKARTLQGEDWSTSLSMHSMAEALKALQLVMQPRKDQCQVAINLGRS